MGQCFLFNPWKKGERKLRSFVLMLTPSLGDRIAPSPLLEMNDKALRKSSDRPVSHLA